MHLLKATMALRPLSELTPFKALPPTIEYFPLYYLQSGLEESLKSFLQEPNPHPHNSMQLHGYQYRALYNPPPLSPQPKSNLENLVERFIVTQNKTNEALGESINQLTSKFDPMTSH